MKFYTVPEVSKMLAVSDTFVRRLIDKGLLVPHKLESAVRIADDDLRSYVSERRVVKKSPSKAARPKLKHLKFN